MREALESALVSDVDHSQGSRQMFAIIGIHEARHFYVSATTRQIDHFPRGDDTSLKPSHTDRSPRQFYHRPGSAARQTSAFRIDFIVESRCRRALQAQQATGRDGRTRQTRPAQPSLPIAAHALVPSPG
jgi:hypothetical protein